MQRKVDCTVFLKDKLNLKKQNTQYIVLGGLKEHD